MIIKDRETDLYDYFFIRFSTSRVYHLLHKDHSRTPCGYTYAESYIEYLTGKQVNARHLRLCKTCAKICKLLDWAVDQRMVDYKNYKDHRFMRINISEVYHLMYKNNWITHCGRSEDYDELSPISRKEVKKLHLRVCIPCNEAYVQQYENYGKGA